MLGSYNSNRPPDLRSATKSITALLIGIAIDQGKIPEALYQAVAEILRELWENER